MERSEEYLNKIMLDAFERHVIIDANIMITCEGRKLKAYCPESGTFLQFPRDIRKISRKFKADVIKAKNESGRIYYRAYKGSIREIIDSKEVLIG
jgi:hypothetical protein